MTTEQIYRRYMGALERVSGGGVWFDTGAVRLAFQLALTDAYDAGREDGLAHQTAINQEYCVQIDRLAEYLVKHGHAEEVLIDLDPAAIVTRAIATIGNLVLANSRLDAGPALAAWLGAHLEIMVDGDTPVAQAISALTYYHDLVTAQQAALAHAAEVQRQLREQLRSALLRLTEMEQRAGMLRAQREELEELYAARQIDLANERAAVDALRQQSAQPPAAINVSPNGNGHVTGLDWSGLSPEAADFRLGLERGAHVWRKLPLYVRLNLVQCVLRQGDGQPLRQDDFDAIRPAWMPTASGLPKQFGASWAELPTLSDAKLLAVPHG